MRNLRIDYEKSPALNPGNLRGRRTPLIIVCHMIDSSADGIAPHPARIGPKLFRLQQNWFYAHGNCAANGIAGTCQIVVAQVS